jgi:pSer/pThr/pTyr-binding forkhead associated (FHA) protein
MANPYFDFRIGAGAEPQRFDLPEGATEIVIGRSSDCGWMISSTAVSRHHARLLRRGGELLIEDLRSSNGTFVNGERLTGPRTLRDQDRVQVGAVEATFVVPPPEADGDATIAYVAKASAPRAPAKPEAPTPPPAPRGGTGTHTVTAPSPPPPPAPAPPVPPAGPSRAEAPAAPAAAPTASPAPSVAADVAPPAGAAVKPWFGGDVGPSAVELALIAAGSFLLVLVIGALLIRLAF